MRPWKRPPDPGLADARAARQRAEEHLAEVRADTPLFRALAASLRELRRENHFAEVIEATFRGGKS